MTAQLIKADGTYEDITPENGKDFTLKECYKYINTDIVEVVYLGARNILIIDEEGKLKDKPVNRKASEMFGYDVIVGDVIYCDKKMFK